MTNSLTDVPGIRVGHATNLEAATGCTVIICPNGTVGGVDQRGGAPGTRETDLLRPMHMVQNVNAVLLSGGSAYGLAAADGVMRYLEENGIGYNAQGGVIVPIVPAAILFDLAVGRADVRPDAAMGYAACQAASSDVVQQGTVGAGTGCRVGSGMGNEYATKGGIGTASIDLGDGLIVAALIAVNAVGDVVDECGQIIAGMRQAPDVNQFAGSLNMMRALSRIVDTPSDGNTVIGVVATNAKLTKEQVNKVAQMAQDGIAQAIRPAHTMFDGDTLFALATGEIPANVNSIGAFAAEAVAQAIRNAVQTAASLAGVRSLKD
ncbi:MAG: peptidase S58 family protein [Anaerolineaceae bacterium]|nr:peptidase S58 family protein [Anaerolineaceae bacterium]